MRKTMESAFGNGCEAVAARPQWPNRKPRYRWRDGKWWLSSPSIPWGLQRTFDPAAERARLIANNQTVTC